MTGTNLVSEAELHDVFVKKYFVKQPIGWSPKIREKFGYYNPDDVYETVVRKLVTPETRWLDVGAGRNLFPSNEPLARELSDRCELLVGVDPDDTIHENPFVHERIHAPVEQLETPLRFNLATMRMVAEHVREPGLVIDRLARVLDPGGRLVIYTVNKWSPVPLASGVVPESLQNSIKNLFWATESKDTFPVVYAMNTRATLREQMSKGGFDEESFAHLDDCRTLGRFRPTLIAELTLWRVLHAVSLPYPENCLLGVYRKRP